MANNTQKPGGIQRLFQKGIDANSSSRGKSLERRGDDDHGNRGLQQGDGFHSRLTLVIRKTDVDHNQIRRLPDRPCKFSAARLNQLDLKIL